MSLPGLLVANPSSLSQQLRSQTDHTLASIVRTNLNTQFALIASELTAFRDAAAGLVDKMDDVTLCETFRKSAQLTTYDAYAPLLARFLEKPCRESAVVDLFAPGLPDYLSRSSSTSGGIPKAFPKYNRLSKAGLPTGTGSLVHSVPVPKRTTAYLFSFRYDSLDIKDENDYLVKRVYLSFAAAVTQRSCLGLDPDQDAERMATFVLDHAAPYAAGFIKTWRSFLIIQGLFALGSRSLEFMCTTFVTTFVEIMRVLDAEFDMVVDCIANGTIPDLDGVAEVRHHLESNIVPDPERAVELRTLGPPSSRPGWCSLVWPNLRSITSSASGSFASSVPLARWFLGPNAKLLARGYGSAEAWVASPYNPFDLEHYKPNNENVTEFLDISKSDSIGAIKQPWEVEFGKHYEIVLTTPEGLWRYRIGDVVEIAGFHPRDGTPIIRFVERRNVVIRFQHFRVTEKELRSAMSFVAADTLGNVVEWTTTVDERQVPYTIGFFVELVGDEEVSDSTLAAERILDALSRSNENVPYAFAHGVLGKPTIRIVGRGTFSDFRQLRIDEGMQSLGQVKVPVVLPKAAFVTWFSNRVVKEL